MSHARSHLRRTGRIGLLATTLGLALAAGLANPAWGAGNGSPSSPQPISKAYAKPGGAIGQCPGGPYCSTRDGAPSRNGNGNGAAVGKPCAGCVGKADNKNPPGQMPDGSDHNNGYECDGNHGIGRTNPAHTGCTSPVTTPKVTAPKVRTPALSPPALTPPELTPPALTPPALTPPALTPPALTPLALTPPALTPPTVPKVTHPLPKSAEAGTANTSGELVAWGSTAFAAFLALGAASALRRRHGDA